MSLAPGSGPIPELAIRIIWGVNQWTGFLSLSSFCPSNKFNFSNLLIGGLKSVFNQLTLSTNYLQINHENIEHPQDIYFLS